MSQNVELARTATEAFNANDLERWASFIDPNVIWHTRADLPDASVYHGLEAYEEVVATWMEMLEDLRMDVEEFIDAGDRVIMVGRRSGRGRASGVAVTDTLIFVLSWRDCKIVEVHEYASRQEALEAVGLGA